MIFLFRRLLNPFHVFCWHKIWEGTVENGQQAKRIPRSSFSFKKTANHRISECTLMAQLPKTSQGRASLSSKVRPQSVKTVQPIRSQHPAWQRRWKLSHMQFCLKRWQSDHTCHHPNRFNELATKSEKWNGKPRPECVDGRHPHSKTSMGVLPWTCRSEGKWPSR